MTPKRITDICAGIEALTFQEMEFFAGLIAHNFSEDMNRQFDEVPSEEITRMAKALVLGASSFPEDYNNG